MLSDIGRNLKEIIWELVFVISLHASCFATNIHDCSELKFSSKSTVPFDDKQNVNGEKMLEFYPGCEPYDEHQIKTVSSFYSIQGASISDGRTTESNRKSTCLFFDDAKMANLMLGGFTIPGYNLSETNNAKDIIENKNIIYDDQSSLYIHGAGFFIGGDNIAYLKALPLQNLSKFVKIGVYKITNIQSYPSASTHKVSVIHTEQWFRLNETISLPYYLKYVNYPCSVMIYSQSMELPEFTFQQFSLIGKEKESDVCGNIMLNCRDNNQQFVDFNSCLTYMRQLPHHDDKCIKKYQTPYTLQGKSFMCKFLHHFMITHQPGTNCFYAGPGKPDKNGKIKCDELDCTDVSRSMNNMNRLSNESNTSEAHAKKMSSRQDNCKNNELNELTSAIVYATFYCLTSLNSNTCFDQCRQGINTLLGRFVTNGVVCKCKNTKVNSKLLTLLEIDVDVLLNICGGKTLVSNSCFNGRDGGNYQYNCNDPNAYQSARGCKTWDWSKFERGMFHDWERMTQWEGRITKSIMVATAECFVVSKLLALKNNYENPLHVQKYISENFLPRYVYFHPTDDETGKSGKYPGSDERNSVNNTKKMIGPMVYKYKDIDYIMQREGSQNRDITSVNFDACVFGTWHKLQNPGIPVLHNINSARHVAGRKFFNVIAPGFLTINEQLTIPRSRNAGLLGEKNFQNGVKPFNNGINDYNEWMGDEVAVEISRFIFGRNSETLTESWHKRVRELAKLASFWYYNIDFHKIHGYGLAVEYMRKRSGFVKSLKKLFELNENNAEMYMDDAIKRSGMKMSVDEGFLYTADIFAAIGGLHFIAKKLIQTIQRNPCKLIPLWEDNPKAFVMEYFRLYSPLSGMRTRLNDSDSSGESKFYSISAANLDEDIFKNPFVFNPKRNNLNNTLTFNNIQGSISKFEYPSDIHNFSITTLTTLIPYFFPDHANVQRCHGNNRIIEGTGVKFTSELVTVLNGRRRLEVYKYKPTYSSGDSLIIAVHAFLGIPQHFAKLFGNMNTNPKFKNFEFWAPTLPGWGESSRIDCKLSIASNILYDFVLREIRFNNRSNVYLMGHGLGSTLMWIVADKITNEIGGVEAKTLKGLISLSAAHPFSHVTRLHTDPHMMNVVKPFLSDLNDAYLNTNDFQFLKEQLNIMNSKWWNKEWDDEHYLFWRKTGVSAIKCYCKDNIFTKVDGSLRFEEELLVKSLNPNTHILMIGGENNLLTNREQFQHTIELLPNKYGKLLHYHHLQGANHFGLILEDIQVNVVINKISNFIEETWRLSNLLTICSWIRIPVRISDDQKDGDIEDISIIYVLLAMFLMLVVGFSFEIHFGKQLKELANSKLNGIVLFAEAMVAPITIACAFTRSWIGIILFAFGAFKMGIPEITLYLYSPFKPSEEDQPSTGYNDNQQNNTNHHDNSNNIIQNSDSHQTPNQQQLTNKRSLTNIFFNSRKQFNLSNFISNILTFSLGLATLVHHIAGFIIYASVLCDLVHPYQLTLVIPASIQHVLSFISQRNPTLYVVIMFLCEVWFQLEGFYVVLNLQTVPAIGTYMTLISHHIFWLHGITENIMKFIFSLKKRESKMENDDDLELKIQLKVPTYETNID